MSPLTREPFWRACPARWLFRRLIDFVEEAALVEVGILGLLPAAKDFVDGEEVELGKHSAVLGGGFLATRAVKTPAGDVLAFVGIEIFQIGFGDRLVAALAGYFIDDGHGWFGENTHRRNYDFKFVGTEFLDCEKRLVLPADQHVPYPTLAEGGG